MKNLLSILLFFTCFEALAQFPISTPRIRVPDRTGIDTTTVANQGQIVFDADHDKIRFNDGTGWFSFLKEGASLPFIPLTGTGDLTGNLTVRGDEHTVNILVRPSTGGVLSIGNSAIGTVPTGNFIRWNSSGATVTGAFNYASEPTYATLSMVAKNYADTHLGGATLPLATEGSENDFIVRGETNFDYVNPAGSGLTNTGGVLSVKGNVSTPVAWTWNNAGDRPSFSVGMSEFFNGQPFDSVAMYTKNNGFTFEVAGTSDIKRIIFKTDSGFVYHKGIGEVNPPVMYYAEDYSGSSRFNDRALVDKGYVDGKVASGAFMPLTGTADATGDISIDGNDFDLNLGSTNGFDLIRLNTDRGIEKTLVQSSGFKVITKQFSASVLDDTAGQQNVVHTIDVSTPTVAYYNIRITSALAVNTANGRIISCNPFTAIAEMDTGTLSGTSATPVNVYHGGPTTGGFNVNFNDAANDIEIRFLNETGTGFQWTIVVEYELMIAE